MPFPSDYAAFSWLSQPALGLEIYTSTFHGVAPEIMGESPYLNAKTAGISFALTKDHSVQSVFLYSSGIEGFAQYEGGMPAGLSFVSSRDDVRNAMGEPAMSAEAGGTGLMAIEYAFDRFEDGVNYIRFEYVPGNAAIRLVTIGLCADW